MPIPHILIVEDDPLILMLAVGVIEDAGYPALKASDADEAMALLERRPEIGIVFTDIEMPGSMDGLELAACIRERWPDVEILVTSGGVRVSDASLPPRGQFLRKPYSARELTAKILALR
ncbi:response regulator [Sphingopyxis sp. Root1497]|uniref:response regulator n=1 Tax=Sphingopyxis sp. Root1497 TaxID=1736474 RepID=UPI000A421145|nr:response regulator [Sphingopyxis sp. Root1497]